MAKHTNPRWTCVRCGGRFLWGSFSLRLIQVAAHVLTNCPAHAPQ